MSNTLYPFKGRIMSLPATSAKFLRRTLQNAEQEPLELRRALEAAMNDREGIAKVMMLQRGCVEVRRSFEDLGNGWRCSCPTAEVGSIVFSISDFRFPNSSFPHQIPADVMTSTTAKTFSESIIGYSQFLFEAVCVNHLMLR